MRTFTLSYIPPGANALHRMHHQEVAAWRRQIRDDVALLLVEAGALADEPFAHARISLDFRWKDKRRHDLDNAVAGMKAACDVLVGRWITDDDTEHLELVVRGRTGTGEPDHVIVTVEAR